MSRVRSWKSAWIHNFYCGFIQAFRDMRTVVVVAFWLFFQPITSCVKWARALHWTRGRQQSGYDKLLLLQGKTWDCWVLRYPEGSFIAEHTDPVDPGLRHFRCNIILWRAASGGEFRANRVHRLIVDLPRIKVFRPDVTPHGVSRIMRGTRYVLSIGWVRRDR